MPWLASIITFEGALRWHSRRRREERHGRAGSGAGAEGDVAGDRSRRRRGRGDDRAEDEARAGVARDRDGVTAGLADPVGDGARLDERDPRRQSSEGEDEGVGGAHCFSRADGWVVVVVTMRAGSREEGRFMCEDRRPDGYGRLCLLLSRFNTTRAAQIAAFSLFADMGGILGMRDAMGGRGPHVACVP